MSLATRDRLENLRRISTESFDLLVIGGGITGAGIALDAASRGLRTALVDRRDFASGTSSRSSKLIHGGLRYLKQLQFKVTFESSREKNRLRRLAPHLIRDLPFVFPVKAGLAGRAAVTTGLWLYDLAAGLPGGMIHRKIDVAEAARLVPGLAEEKLSAAYVYYDACADDCRLVIHVVKKAAEFGACVANYAEVVGFDDDRTARIRADGRELTARAKVIVNATGVWCDDVLRRRTKDAPRLVRPSKGVHLVVSRERLPLEAAAILQSPEDGRVVFLIPAGERVIVGTTDTDYSGDIDHPRAETKDVEYLLGLVNRHLPAAKMTRADVVSTFAGLRPLMNEDAENPSKVSRDHVIVDDGILTITGGKLTTYRLMAKQVTDRVCRKLGVKRKCGTHRIPLFAAERSDDALVRNYGSEAAKIADRTPLIDGLSYVEGEPEYAVTHEMAATLADVLARRMRVVLFDREQGRGIAEKVARRLAPLTGWNVSEQVEGFEREIEDYPK
ncbi:MAG: glycerol-3-phosphate dehydrogenase/oxidase [Planctomycetes bacterium]|nr:glycerol-3-phosphate dehydrogenase/oxidase [Planctomycetota bacterium]